MRVGKMKNNFATFRCIWIGRARSPFFALFSALLIGSLSTVGIQSALADVSSLQPDTLALINEFLATLTPPMLRKQLVEADVPAIGCPLGGPEGPEDTPTLPKTVRVVVPEGTTSGLAYYSECEGAGIGVVAPKGWDCFGTHGTAGSTLYVTPDHLSDPIPNRHEKVKNGPVVIRNMFSSAASGRYLVADISARIFPLAREFVQRVDPKSSVFTPWPYDRLNRLSDFVVSYVTPAGTDGLGTAFGPTPGPQPISGLVFLRGDLTGGDGPVLERIAVRLKSTDQRSFPAIAVSSIASKIWGSR
jgi:hypothetical protein